MPRFLFLVSGPPAPGMGSIGEWVARHAATGVIRSASRLASGTRLSRGDAVCTVGEAPALRAFAVVEAEDGQAALALAGSCPGSDPGTIDLYRLDLADALGEALVDAATLR